MSNRQKATHRWLGRAPRPPGTVSSASHGFTVFRPVAWFKDNKVKPCTDETCGIKSGGRTAHFHPKVGKR